MIKVFLDTNILVDFLQRREPFFKEAVLIMQYGEEGLFNLITSSISIINCVYILRKSYKGKELYSKIKELMSIVEVVEIDSEMIEQAVSLEWKDFEDCIQYISAKHSNANIIVSRNEKDFECKDIPVVSSFDFFDKIICL